VICGFGDFDDWLYGYTTACPSTTPLPLRIVSSPVIPNSRISVVDGGKGGTDISDYTTTDTKLRPVSSRGARARMCCDGTIELTLVGFGSRDGM
jgi:hypothetical protein